MPQLKSPFSHALVHTIVGLVVGALVIALQEALVYLAQAASPDLATIGREAALIFVIALGHGAFRYIEANSDPIYKFAAGAADQALTSEQAKLVPDGTKGDLAPPAVS